MYSNLVKIYLMKIRKKTNYYGVTKLKLENYILTNKKKFNYKIGIGRIFNYYNSEAKKRVFLLMM